MLFAMEMIGTVAFALSGAMVGIKKDYDLLGIIVLGVITAVGGGMIRDLTIGVTPPVLFVKPVYVTVAIISVLVLFNVAKYWKKSMKYIETEAYENLLNIMDAIGLGIFTVIGVSAGINNGFENMYFLQIFLGVITGVGGGLLRDIMAMETPSVLKRHIYACASLAGAVMYVMAYGQMPDDIAAIVSIVTVVVIRLLARHYQWNLPHVWKKHDK